MSTLSSMRSVDPQDRAVTYAAVLDALPIVAYMARPDGSISYVSNGYERLTGNSVTDLVADGYASIIHPDDLPFVGSRWSSAVANGSSYQDDFRVRFADGAYRWITSRADPLIDGGRVIGWFGTLTDIDARKRAEAALLQSESTYRAFAAAIPGVTWAASPSGELTFVGDAWTTLHGKPREDALGEAWLESVHVEDRQRVLAVWAHSIATGEPYDIQFRLRILNGPYHWFLVRALPVRDDAGTIVQWVGVNVDIEQQRRADQSREQFVRLIENSDDCIGIVDTDGHPTYVNGATRRLLGIAPSEETTARNLFDYFVPEDRVVVSEDVLPAVKRDGRWSGELRLQNFQSGEAIPFAYNIFSLLDDDGAIAAFATVSHDLRERDRLEAGLRVLADTGAVMFSSLDFEQTIRNVAAAVVRDFATYCVFDMLDQRGRLTPIASVHSDSALADVLDRAVAKRRVADRHHAFRAAHEGVSTLKSELEPDWLKPITEASDDDLSLLAARSMMCVPLRAGISDEVIGALTLVIDARAPRGAYTERDLHFAEEVGRRAGIAFEHAKAYERERRIAVTLQAASLPTTLPEIPGLRLSAEYRGGNSESTIGGDWYDAFQLDDGRVVISIGDVMGNGLAAAVTMGKLRQAIQSVALVSGDPQLMLDAADRIVRSISPNSYATALAAIYDPGSGEIAMASAGHPGPAVRAADGQINFVNISGMLLGLRFGKDSETITLAASPGAAFVFFTDGLIEMTRDADEGYRRLAAAIGTHVDGSNPDLARAIVNDVVGDRTSVDDIALLVASVHD